jgi:hypothetical protein
MQMSIRILLEFSTPIAALLNPEMTAAFVVVFLFFDRSAS